MEYFLLRTLKEKGWALPKRGLELDSSVTSDTGAWKSDAELREWFESQDVPRIATSDEYTALQRYVSNAYDRGDKEGLLQFLQRVYAAIWGNAFTHFLVHRQRDVALISDLDADAAEYLDAPELAGGVESMQHMWAQLITRFVDPTLVHVKKQFLSDLYIAAALVADLLGGYDFLAAAALITQDEGESMKGEVEFWDFVYGATEGSEEVELDEILGRASHVCHPEERMAAMNYLVDTWRTECLARLEFLHARDVFTGDDGITPLPPSWRRYNAEELQKAVTHNMRFISRGESVHIARQSLARLNRALGAFWGWNGMSLDAGSVWMDARGLPGRCSQASALEEVKKTGGAGPPVSVCEAVDAFTSAMVSNPQCATAMRAAFFTAALLRTPWVWSVHDAEVGTPVMDAEDLRTTAIAALDSLDSSFWEGCPVDAFGSVTAAMKLHGTVKDTQGSWSEWWARTTGTPDIAKWEKEHVWKREHTIAAAPSFVIRAPPEDLAAYLALGSMWTHCMEQGVVPCIGEIRGEWRLQSHVTWAAYVDVMRATTKEDAEGRWGKLARADGRRTWMQAWAAVVGAHCALTQGEDDVSSQGLVDAWPRVVEVGMHLFSGMPLILQAAYAEMPESMGPAQVASFFGVPARGSSVTLPSSYNVADFASCKWPL